MRDPIPADIRRACMLFNLQPEHLSTSAIVDAWEKQITLKRLFDSISGGDQTYLNSAKEILIGWIQENPHHGTDGNPDKPSGVPRRPRPDTGSSTIALPSPESETET